MYKINLAYIVSNILSSNHTAQKKICPHKSSSWPSLPQPAAAILHCIFGSRQHMRPNYSLHVTDLQIWKQNHIIPGRKHLHLKLTSMHAGAGIHSFIEAHMPHTGHSQWYEFVIWLAVPLPPIWSNSTAREKDEETQNLSFWKQACIHSHQWPKTLLSPSSTYLYSRAKFIYWLSYHVRRRQKSGITERDLSHFRYLSVLAVRLNKQNKEKPATIKFTRRWAKRERGEKKLLLDRQSYTV